MTMNPAELYAASRILQEAMDEVSSTLSANAKAFADSVRAKSLVTDFGTVSVTQRKPSIQLDPDAFTAWVRENRPDELMVGVRPSFVAAWKKHLVPAGDGTTDVIDPTTGEIAPYARITTGSDYLTFRKGDGAGEMVDRAEEALMTMLSSYVPHQVDDGGPA